VLSVLFNLFSKGILFLLIIIIARYFGSNIKTDIYFFVFGTMVLFSGFINSIDTAVLIPESMRLREKEGNNRAAAFLNFFLAVYLLIGIAFIILMYFFGTTVFGLISKFSETDILTYRNYFWLGSLFFIFQILTNYINAILTSLKFFSLPMLISALNSCIVIAGIFLLKADYDVLSIFIGGLAAYAVNLIFLLFVMKKFAGWKFIFKTSGIPKKVRTNIFYAGLGQITTVASSLFPLYLLSGFGTGIISAMNYGKNIADIPNTLVTSQFANVSGIKLNEQSARHDHEGMNETFVRTGKLLVFILVPMGFYLFVFAAPIVEFFYHSRNFTPGAATGAAIFLKLLAITIFSIGINAMVTRVFIAVQAIKQAFFYQVGLSILLITAIWICTKYYGAYGYPYGIIIMNMVNYFAMYFICRKLVPQIDYAALLKYTGLIIIINAAIAAGLYVAVNYFKLSGLLNIILGFLLYLISLLFLNNQFNLNIELKQIFKHVKQKFY
jgi:peptidoglycan biosynthesis protein MviN/MurJ (putative lipid II flippase)